MTDNDQLHLSRQLLTLLKSGLPLLDAVKLMGIQTIEQGLMSGKNLSFIMSEHGFHPFCIGLIRSGEATGDLLTSFQSISNYLDKKIKLNKKFKKALTYPCIVGITSCLVLAIIFHCVIPTFEMMFLNFNATLPLPTLLLIKCSRLFQEYFLYVFIYTCFFILGLSILWKNSASFQLKIDLLLIKLPIWGKIRISSTVSQWGKSMSTLCRSGIPILDALKETALSSNDWVIYYFCSELKQLLSQGWSLSESIDMTSQGALLIKPEYLQLLRVGEASGDLPYILDVISHQEEERLNQLIDQLSQSIEPLLMVFMGLIVGTLVISLYLPIFEMGQIL